MPPWLGFPEERVLPQPPESYTVKKEEKDWWCVRDAAGVLVYSGVGPVEVVRSPSPF
ncbi:hypothetical protein [Comamonas terrigena]|jgi:hypothetical protein|uniref:hypothetical protein n=1 Tax=Comamonas terrigena TaxID=32013 RepID=UPI0023521FE0|nr:hypothetical protein [Comamonas terrigena]